VTDFLPPKVQLVCRRRVCNLVECEKLTDLLFFDGVGFGICRPWYGVV
jgi:hypothetical protein